MRRVKRVDVGGMIYHALNRANFRSRLFRRDKITVPDPVYTYGVGGELLLRYTGDSNSRSFVPFGGRLLAEYYCGGMIFDHPDGIGSATTSTDCTGNTVNEKLYYAFGGGWTGAALPNLGMHQEFAQLPDYDPETGQYNTLYRRYVPSIGRWLSPDPLAGDVTNPQSLNRYAYVLNNPTTLTDPDGLVSKVPPGCYAVSDNNPEHTSHVVCPDASDVELDAGLLARRHNQNTGEKTTPEQPPDRKDPCVNSTLAAAGTTAQQQIATAQAYIAAGQTGASLTSEANPVFRFFGGMLGYFLAVHTGGPNDIKNQSGPEYHTQVGVDAGNISFGITCPYGAKFCQGAAGAAQFGAALFGRASFGSPRTFMDTPSDNASIKVGQAMRAAGCHE